MRGQSATKLLASLASEFLVFPMTPRANPKDVSGFPFGKEGKILHPLTDPKVEAVDRSFAKSKSKVAARFLLR